MYEDQNDQQLEILIDQRTIERLFYVSLSLKKLYNIIQENQENLNTFYKKLEESFKKDAAIEIQIIEIK